MKILIILITLVVYSNFFAQSKLEISGGIDLYYGLNPWDLDQENIPIYVSSNQLNSASVNLGLIDFKYKIKDRVRFQLTPAIGSFMNANYAAENKYLRWIYESSIGISRENEIQNGLKSEYFPRLIPLKLQEVGIK